MEPLTTVKRNTLSGPFSFLGFGSRAQAAPLAKGDKRLINAWTFYDWANSSYPMVITSTIFPIFYENVTSTKVDGLVVSDVVTLFGWSFRNSQLYSYVAALAFIIVSISSPVLSGIADSSGSKKKFLQFYCYLGSLCCASLFFFNKEYLGLCMLSVLFASVGYWGSIVFYNAYLPEIAEPADHDKVSAKGFARGYLGGALLLIINLILIKAFGMPAKYSFISVALWWFGFAQLAFPKLPRGVSKRRSGEGALTRGFKELWKVWNEFKGIPRLKRFLASFFIYSMGVQTVMLMAVLFAKKEIKDLVQVTETVNGVAVTSMKVMPIADTALITAILLIQFLGIAGSHLFSFLSRLIGNLKALGIILAIWIAVCFSLYQFVYTSTAFFIAASVVGLVMGGVQSLSRSTYSKLLPETKDNASYFSFYDVCEKVGIVIGMFSFGFIEGLTGGMRNSILALITYFAVGFLVLTTVPKTKQVN
jgi:UMF1 family MFS transporter